MDLDHPDVVAHPCLNGVIRCSTVRGLDARLLTFSRWTILHGAWSFVWTALLIGCRTTIYVRVTRGGLRRNLNIASLVQSLYHASQSEPIQLLIT